jgi:hypothetical protein
VAGFGVRAAFSFLRLRDQPMGTRPRVRGSNSAFTFYLYPADTTLGWRVIRRVTAAQGVAKLAAGQWREVFDEYGNHWGYQVVANFRTDQELPSGASSSSITVREMLLNAGVFFPNGKSRTAGMTEDKRISRKHPISGKKLAPEDAVERARAKVSQWPHPASRIDDGTGAPRYGDLAVRVYPKIA